MVFETLVLVCSWHPGREDDFNALNPGTIISVTTDRDLFTYHASVGGYIDSYKRLSTVAGVGFDLGRKVGVGLMIGHVSGSDMGKYPVVPIPSFFYRGDSHGFRIVCMGAAFAAGYTYTFKP